MTKPQWLGEAMLRVALAKERASAPYLLTAMDRATGSHGRGTALELAEAIDVCAGQGPPDVVTWSRSGDQSCERAARSTSKMAARWHRLEEVYFLVEAQPGNVVQRA